MSRTAKDYSKGKVYRVICNKTGKVYIGSTCSTLTKRLSEHKKSYKQWLKKTLNYNTVFEIIEQENYNIILIEEYPCKNINQLEARERFFIESMLCVNKQIPGRTQKEYRADNRNTILQQKQEYREQNRDIINEKQKEKIKCVCGSIHNRSHKARHEKSNKHINFISK